MRIRLQALLRGTVIAAVMAVAISFAPGAARADALGDTVKSNVQQALTDAGITGAQATAVLNALNGTTDGASMLDQLSSMNLPTNVAGAVGTGLGKASGALTATNPQAALQIQLAAGNNPSMLVGFLQGTLSASGFTGGFGNNIINNANNIARSIRIGPYGT